MAKSLEPDSGSRNQINAGTVIQGDIRTEGNIRIDGMVVGTVRSKGKVVVGTTGKIEGEIECQNANISGELKAKITVAELLTLQSTAKLVGDIVTNKLAIEPGASFSGSCSMGGAVIKELADHAEPPTEEEPPAEEEAKAASV